ncbi:MAG: ROK family protein [Clostridiales bacterium]|nr:ROK family protein [Clostridiales bacterium]
MYYIGVDLGGTNIAAGIVSEEGELLLKRSVPTLNGREYQPILKDMAELCLALIAEYGISLDEVKSIGVGSPGTPDPPNGILVYANHLKFENTPIRAEIQKYVDLPVYLENDANCAALGEYTSGAAKGAKNAVMVTLGTGVGGGVIFDGKIMSGAYYGGGELGHVVVQFNGEQCTCGRKGCWEAYASASALIRDTKVAIAKNPLSGLSESVNGDIKLVTAKTPFDAAQQGCALAQAVVDRYVHYVSEGIANVINTFQPEIVVIGGGVCYQGDIILKPIKEQVSRMVFGGNLKTEIMIATLGNDAGIIGAAMLGK